MVDSQLFLFKHLINIIHNQSLFGIYGIQSYEHADLLCPAGPGEGKPDPER